ncbi:TATA box-binding protein-associated factor RNA polymerase I subunit B [Amphibalanus amphitrite]|uniref:TATA box-binding protein-associated factor RNA polymerase I subunit B n=1 Tax=Amphibalanus amphitrite TaxID=1232801 RepID=A0A6A4W4E9_AMPAM|nr:TATA box-binding protein-associated factor RNA polymerase I subunit B [Amphibalanus amphitrite]
MTVCDVCGGDQFSAHDGFYFCDECHTQSQDIRDLATDDDFVQTGMSSRNFVISDATRAKRQRQKERKAKQRVARIKITPKEVLNLLLHRWSAALVARGAPAQLTEATAQLWEVVLRSGRANTRMFRGVTAAVMLLWLALVDCEPLCRLSDVFRWSRQGVLPVLTARNEMPEDVSTDRCNTFVVGKLMNMAKIREQLSSMVNKLGLPPPPQPSLHRLLRRLLDELVLPTQLADVVTNVARLGSPPDTYMPEASALAMLLITLKMLLGLDDATEVRNSEVAKARNDAIADGPRWFVFTEWLAFMRELRAEASEQDYVELDTADRELETMPGLDYCRHHHRQLLFDYVRREGTFRALEKVSTFQNYNSAEYRLQLMKLFGRVLTPQMPPPPSESDDLLRPVASRLEHHGGELLRRANEFRQSRVDYLLDDSHVRALKAEGVAVAVTLTAARQRIPSEVSILRPSQTEGVRAWSRDIVLVDDPDEAGDMQRRIRERHPAPWRRPPLDDLRLFRPFDEIWRLPQAWMGVPPYRPDYMTEAGALPINYRCLLELLAASIDVVPFHFLRDVVRAEAAVVGMEFLVFNARARREGMDPKVLRFRAKRNKGYYKHWKRKVAKKRTSEGAEPDSKEAEPDSEGIAPTSESRPGQTQDGLFIEM